MKQLILKLENFFQRKDLLRKILNHHWEKIVF